MHNRVPCLIALACFLGIAGAVFAQVVTSEIVCKPTGIYYDAAANPPYHREWERNGVVNTADYIP